MDLRSIDLNLLVAFDMLIAERSVTRAAGRLSIGQSAMSSTLGRLRLLFDDQILVKAGRRMVPTPLAESLAAPVRELLNGIERVFEQRSTFDPTTGRRTFTIIANDYITLTFLQPLIERVSSEFPGIRVHITPPDDDPPDRLRRQLADILFMPREAFEDEIEFPHAVLFEERYLVAVDKDNPDVGESISLEQFTTMPYLAMSPGDRRSMADMQLDLLGISRNIEVTTAFATALFILKGTRMISLVQERLGRKYQDAAGLRLLETPVPQLLPIHMLMLWTQRTETDPGHRWFRQILVELAEEPRTSAL
ncbi:MAG: LysR family transcriptional regulator [Candidatus Leucobacter sulfamidivorax]|nr:LysR family transcriptional regulator [Candidatus Leucobacter sulfamidivorax]